MHTDFGGLQRDTAHHGEGGIDGNVRQLAWSSHGQEAERLDYCHSSHFLLFLQPRAPAQGTVLP